jgi:hypothetical protein
MIGLREEVSAAYKSIGTAVKVLHEIIHVIFVMSPSLWVKRQGFECEAGAPTFLSTTAVY